MPSHPEFVTALLDRRPDLLQSVTKWIANFHVPNAHYANPKRLDEGVTSCVVRYSLLMN